MFFARAGLAGLLLTANLTAQTPAATPGFDLNAIDRSADPCSDFYQHACGNWIRNNPVPSDQSSWDRFSELDQQNQTVLRGILEAAVASKTPDAVTKKIGDYYAACMDQAAIDKQGLLPLREYFTLIDNMKSKADLALVLARLHRVGARAIFNFESAQDFKDSSSVIAEVDQSGLGLPERDYYFRTDAKAVETRAAYLAHLTRLLALLSVKEDAHAVLDLETAIANVSLDITSRRDPEKLYHLMKVTDLASLADSFSWTTYFVASRAPRVAKLNVTEPEFFKGIEALLKSQPLAVWKTYLKLRLIHATPVLPSAFDQEEFSFHVQFLTGAKEQKPRWKRCVEWTDGDLGEALGRAYVAKTFGAEGKQRMLAMVSRLDAAMVQDIQQLTWMTPATRQKALEKLHAITNKIGYPDRWRDYSSLRIVRNDAMGNSLRGTEFEFNRQLQKIGKPVDRGEWSMTPPTVNAYYDGQMNNINFPAGILQPPFFDKNADDATNFGAIGAIIGHEMTHGFDDEGRQFDAKGNLNDWWTEVDAKAFEERSSCFVNEYSAFEVQGGVHMNGKLTLGENTADNGGLRIAWIALMKSLAGHSLPVKEGYTAEQRFFIGWAQAWCENATEEYQRLKVQTDPHSVDRFRVDGVVANMPEFQKAFSCPANAPLVRTEGKSCRVW